MAKVKRRPRPQWKFTSELTPKEAKKERVRFVREQKYAERRAQWDAYYAQFTSPDYKEKWVNDPLPLCPECNEPKDTIKVRVHPYILELSGREEFLESCMDCWHMWRLEV